MQPTVEEEGSGLFLKGRTAEFERQTLRYPGTYWGLTRPFFTAYRTSSAVRWIPRASMMRAR